jgi:hypothetical protein
MWRAAAIIREEAHQTQETTHLEHRRAMNPLAAGIGLFVIGAGLAFIMPAVLTAFGFVAFVWGALISGFRKQAMHINVRLEQGRGLWNSERRH